MNGNERREGFTKGSCPTESVSEKWEKIEAFIASMTDWR
jgi:hypothetical protein